MSKVWGYIREIMVEKKLSVEEIIERCSFRAIGFYEEALVVSLETAKEVLKRAKEEERENVFKRVKVLIEKISTYKSEIDSLVNIGRQNAISDLENEFEEIKKGRKDYKDNRDLDKIAEDLSNEWVNNSNSIFNTKEIILEGLNLIIKREREKIYKFSENWFDEKRKNNEMWRMNQDELTCMFLDELKKELDL